MTLDLERLEALHKVAADVWGNGLNDVARAHSEINDALPELIASARELEQVKAENERLAKLVEDAATAEVSHVVADLRITEAERDALAARLERATELLKRLYDLERNQRRRDDVAAFLDEGENT